MIPTGLRLEREIRTQGLRGFVPAAPTCRRAGARLRRPRLLT